MIVSMHNPRVKQAIRLRDRRQRRKTGLILIDGARELARALAAGVTLEDVFVCPQLCRNAESLAVLKALPASGAQRIDVNESVFAKLAYGQRTEGLLGVGKVPCRRLQEISLPASALVAVLEGVEKPGNVGAVLRQRRRSRRVGPLAGRRSRRFLQSQCNPCQPGNGVFVPRCRGRPRRHSCVAA